MNKSNWRGKRQTGQKPRSAEKEGAGGRGGGTTRISPDSQAGKGIGLVIRNENRAGMDAVERWIDQIDPERRNCDWWEFEGKKTDGALIKDLNDCNSITAEDAGKLEGLLP